MSPSATLSANAEPNVAPPSAPGAELTVIVPTFNERDNVARLVARLDAALAGVRWEAIFVDDDSPDGTGEVVAAIAAGDARIRRLRRVGRRGLAGAVIEGVLASAAPFVAVIDADLQHDEGLLPRMLAVLQGGEVDLVLGSRYLDSDGPQAGLSALRRWGSGFATTLGRLALKSEVSDPVSGFFMVRREAFDRVAGRLEPAGFKILFDLIASQPTPLKIKELPYAFRARTAGESKLDGRVVIDYLGLVAAKLSRDVIKPRMVFFALVGLSGVVVHMSVLTLVHGLRFWVAQAVAAITAMTSNYLINNAVTYRDRRLERWGLVTGYLRFLVRGSISLVANVAVAAELHVHGLPWPLAGLAGAVCGAVLNYVSAFVGVW